MLMLATLLAPQCVNRVWRNAAECNNTSFTVLIKFVDVSKRRKPAAHFIGWGGGVQIHPLFDRPVSGFHLSIYLLHVNTPPHPPSISATTHRSGSPVSEFLSATLRGKQNKHFLEFLSRWTHHTAALGACFWHSHLFVITKKSDSFFSLRRPLPHRRSAVAVLNNCTRQQVLSSPADTFQSFLFFISEVLYFKKKESTQRSVASNCQHSEKNPVRSLIIMYTCALLSPWGEKTWAMVQENIPIYAHRLGEDSVGGRIFHPLTSKFYFEDVGLCPCIVFSFVCVYPQRTRWRANNSVRMQWIW